MSCNRTSRNECTPMWSKTLSPDFFNQSLFPTIVLIPLFFEHLQTLSTVLKALPVLSHLILITDASGAMYPFSLTHHQLPTTITWTSPSGLLLFLNFFYLWSLELDKLVHWAGKICWRVSIHEISLRQW